jgi:K+-sensing histidine kinase KdpD
VRRAEPVPDAFVRPAISRWSTLRRRHCGTGWLRASSSPAKWVDAAVSSYFRFANLAALREFAQLWLDDCVPDSVAAFLAARGISGPVNASVIVVGLKGSPADEWLIPYAAHLAGLSDARLQGVYVRAIDNLDRPPKA